MSADVTAALERLRTSTQRLNSVCDQAATVVREVEALLQENQVGAHASVKVWRDEDEEVCLAYGRHSSGKFRLLITYSPAGDYSPEQDTSRPWAEVSREEKLASFEKLPPLLVELAKRADEQAAKAEQTVAAVTAALPLSKKRKGA